jgi:hypothetical protein
MKKNSLALTIAAALCTAAVATAAQTAGAAPKDTGAPQKLRLTGCLERAEQLMGNGSTTASVDSMDLVLMKARPASEGQAANRGASARPTGTSGGSNDVGKMYRLSADTVKANPHVGHEVEIVGSIQTAGPGVVPGAGAAAAVDKTNPSAADAPMLKVESLRMISDTCPK